MNKPFYLTSKISIKGRENGSDGLKIAGYANTKTKDRSKDVILPSAWTKALENFNKNPILLYQHKMDCPIGRIEKTTIDENGLHVEAFISDVAETKYGVHTLIKDGALKSFSVGFIPKDGKYDRKSDTAYISDLELIEISIVSVPDNPDSLFNIRKSLSEESVRKIFNDATEEELEIINKELAPINIVNDGTHEVSDKTKIIVSSILKDNIRKTIKEIDGIPVEKVYSKLPLDIAMISPGSILKYGTNRVMVIDVPNDQNNQSFTVATVNLEGKSISENFDIDQAKINVLNIWDENKNFDIEIVSSTIENARTKEEIDNIVNDLFTASISELKDLKKQLSINLTGNSLYKYRLNLAINLLANREWDESAYNVANKYIDFIEEIKATMEASDEKNLILMLHGFKDKEIIEMPQEKEALPSTNEAATVQVTPVLVEKSATVVSEPRVAKLIEETGAKIMEQATEDTRVNVDNAAVKRLGDEIADLTAAMKREKEAIAALNHSKMVYAENQANPFSARDITKALVLGFWKDNNGLRMDNPEAVMKSIASTKFGSKVTKAVTSVDAFLSNFSTDLNEQMEMELVIAKMLRRMPIDARTFRIPVADEDTDGDIAQFAAGTFVTSPTDTTRVPTTNQHSFSAVELSPTKFMGTTHLAKDEQEDTILPLIDFLMSSTMRRMGRAIDKALLRGDGSLSGFTAQPTNDITAGTGYACVFKGLTTLANDISGLRVQTGGNATKATPANIASARALLGRYGLKLGSDLVYLTSIEGYNELVTNSDFRTVDKFGPNATYLTGAVGAVYGIPIMITEFLDNVGAANYHVGLLVYKPGFLIGERKALEIESKYEPRQQASAIYISTRFDMKALTTNSAAALDATKYSMASIVRSGA